MFLEVGQRVTVLELMKGLAVSSGNDAAVAAAELLAGGVPEFVARMNREARRLGLVHTRFADPAGLSARNATTAREYARFCRRYIREHPEAIQEIHALRTFAYPLAHNLPEAGSHVPFAVEQRNRNLLVARYPGADGLKTGYIDESGYNLAVTAERDGMRLVAVVLGVAGQSHREGGENRAIVGAALLDYGFDHFVNVRPAVPAAGPVRVWRGVATTVGLKAGDVPLLTLLRDRARDLEVRATVTPVAVAPVPAGRPLGTATVELSGRVLADVELRAAAAVTRAAFLRRWYRTTLQYARELAGAP
jgi:D-alanyl-D-alanine carboxypeptidase (penicillin-binding protein 5/6)